MTIIIGIIGFFFLYIYEMNQILWKRNFIKTFFFTGFLLILLSTILTIGLEVGNYNPVLWQIVLAILLFALFTFLLIYTLFFSIPFEASYVEQFDERYAYTEKMYALCRHPGVLWLIGVYIALIIITPTTDIIILTLVINGLNILYVVIQDYWSFPVLFSDYNDYKKETPFLLPNIKSIKRTISTYTEGD